MPLSWRYHCQIVSPDFACEDFSAQFEHCIIIYSVGIYFFRWSKQLSYRIKCYLRKEVGRQSVTRSIVMGSELVSSVTGVLECHTVPLSLTRSTSHTQESSNVCPRILPASLSGSMSLKVTLTLPSLIHSKCFHCYYRNFWPHSETHRDKTHGNSSSYYGLRRPNLSVKNHS